jgi:DNA-binding XRE family transcriptional regulator
MNERRRIKKMTLADLREEAGLSQKELGNVLGVTDQTVSNWEKARAIPKLTIRQVVELLAVLPCTLTELAEICDEIERQVRAKQEAKQPQFEPKTN